MVFKFLNEDVIKSVHIAKSVKCTSEHAENCIQPGKQKKHCGRDAGRGRIDVCHLLTPIMWYF